MMYLEKLGLAMFIYGIVNSKTVEEPVLVMLFVLVEVAGLVLFFGAQKREEK